MIESKYLKENLENIQKLMTIPALKNFETRSLGKLLRLSKVRQYEDGERIIQEGDLDQRYEFPKKTLISAPLTARGRYSAK
jgi:hypothetical protein